MVDIIYIYTISLYIYILVHILLYYIMLYYAHICSSMIIWDHKPNWLTICLGWVETTNQRNWIQIWVFEPTFVTLGSIRYFLSFNFGKIWRNNSGEAALQGWHTDDICVGVCCPLMNSLLFAVGYSIPFKVIEVAERKPSSVWFWMNYVVKFFIGMYTI